MTTMRKRRISRTIATLMLTLALAGPLTPPALVAAAWAQSATTRLKDRAWEAYRANDFRTALTRAEEAITTGGLAPPELADAWKLKGLCLTDLNRNDEAITAFETALKLDRTITVEGGDYIPEEIQNFRQARARLEKPAPVPRPAGVASPGQKSAGWKKWYIIGPAVAVLGIVAATALGGGGGTTGNGALPGFPEPPR